MWHHRWLAALILLAACGPVRKPQVDKGDPVQNVVHVRFASEVKGEGLLLWTAAGREHRRPLGPSDSGEWETSIWLPSGKVSQVRGAVVDNRGEIHEGPANRVRIKGAPSKIHFEVDAIDPGASQIGDGVILLNAYDDDDSYAFAVDRDGEILWWVEPDQDDQRILRVRPGLDDHSIVYGRWAQKHLSKDDGFITRMQLSAGQGRTDTRAFEHHHDWVELPDNRFAWLSWVYRDPIFVPGRGPKPVASDAIRIADEGAVEGEETILFDFFEDYPHDVYYPCGHMNPGGFRGPDWWEWSHSNSIAYDADSDSIRILARYLDAVLEIGLDGSLHWQAGGRYSDFDTQGWFHHAHASELDGDRMVVFDNGNHGPQPEVSRALGLDLDVDGRTVTEAWSIPDPQGEFTDFLGDVRTLPGGNILVLFSPRGEILEFTPAGRVVWKAQIAGNAMVVGRMTWTDTLEPR